MTLKEKVKEIQPDCINDNFTGGVCGCPGYYSYLNAPLLRFGVGCGAFNHCEDCWNNPFVDKSVETMSHGRDINVLSKYEAAMNYLFQKSVDEDVEKDILITLQTVLNYAHKKGKV